MAYVREDRRTGVSVLTVEQARRRNAELRRELVTLTQENGHLEAQISTLRLQITAARRKLTSQVRQLEASRLQVERLAKVTASAWTDEPKYGGREGLLAATAELLAHEAQAKKRAA